MLSLLSFGSGCVFTTPRSTLTLLKSWKAQSLDISVLVMELEQHQTWCGHSWFIQDRESSVCVCGFQLVCRAQLGLLAARVWKSERVGRSMWSLVIGMSSMMGPVWLAPAAPPSLFFRLSFGLLHSVLSSKTFSTLLFPFPTLPAPLSLSVLFPATLPSPGSLDNVIRGQEGGSGCRARAPWVSTLCGEWFSSSFSSSLVIVMSSLTNIWTACSPYLLAIPFVICLSGTVAFLSF